MNDELSDDIEKKFMLPLTIELQDHKEKVFHNAPVSATFEMFPILVFPIFLLCLKLETDYLCNWRLKINKVYNAVELLGIRRFSATAFLSVFRSSLGQSQ